MDELHSEAPEQPSGSSRRTFLASAGVGAAVVGVAAASPSFASSGATKTLSDPSVVVTVVDAVKGVFAINVGEREVLVTDKAFASRIATAIA